MNVYLLTYFLLIMLDYFTFINPWIGANESSNMSTTYVGMKYIRARIYGVATSCKKSIT